MQVCPINNNQVNFTSVVRLCDKKEYSVLQNKTADDIEALMKRPTPFLNGKSPNDFYSNKGYDFGIVSCYDHKRVNLIGYKEAKNLTANAEPDDIKAKSRFIIGSFDYTDRTINIFDVLNKMGEEIQKETANIGVKVFHSILAVIALAAWMPVVYVISNAKQAAEQVQPQTENVGKTVVSDSVKAAKEFIEVIKNRK